MKRRRERLNDSHKTGRLRELFADNKEEQSATAAKIEEWLRLSDKSLIPDQPAHIDFSRSVFYERRSNPRRP
jgi:hypothetical protein